MENPYESNFRIITVIFRVSEFLGVLLYIASTCPQLKATELGHRCMNIDFFFFFFTKLKYTFQTTENMPQVVEDKHFIRSNVLVVSMKVENEKKKIKKK